MHLQNLYSDTYGKFLVNEIKQGTGRIRAYTEFSTGDDCCAAPSDGNVMVARLFLRNESTLP